MGDFSGTLELPSQSLHKVSTTSSHKLGTRWTTPDGKSFRYAVAGGALTIGRVIGHIAKAVGLASDGLPAGTAGRTTAEWDRGVRTFDVATTASATTSLHIYADRYVDGYFWVNDQAGSGQLLQIKSHGISTSVATTQVTITMYEDELLTVALTTASQWGLTENMYKDVVIHLGKTAAGPALGVATRAVVSGEYFWLQTWGPCVVMAGPDTLLAGEPASVGITTGTSTGLAMVAGSIYPENTTKETRDFMQPEIGYVITPATGDAQFALVFLTCAP